MNEPQPLELWTIYERPRDYPEGYVVRRQVIGGGRSCSKCLANEPHGTPAEPCPLADRVAQYAPDLLTARALVPRGKFRLPRSSEDDSVIVECWI